MFPTVETVTLVPVEEMERRFAAIHVARTNQMMHQYLFEPLVDWARLVTREVEPIEVQAFVQTVVIALSEYAERIGPAGKNSFALLLPLLISGIVKAMIDSEAERSAALDGISAAFASISPPAA